MNPLSTKRGEQFVEFANTHCQLYPWGRKEKRVLDAMLAAI